MAATMVGLVIAVISLFVAVIIGGCQIKQNNRMAAFEKRQDERDEKRHNDEIYAEVTRFIQKYSVGGYEAEIYLLPLCITAYQYNPVYPYRREIYREFCGLPEECRNLFSLAVTLIFLAIKVITIFRNVLTNCKKKLKSIVQLIKVCFMMAGNTWNGLYCIMEKKKFLCSMCNR